MTTKEALATWLDANRGEYFSGEEIARRLGVSRAAIWKAIQTLRGEGYAIDAVTRKGYCLLKQTDILSAGGIRKYLSSACPPLTIDVRNAASSTNALLREKADAGAPEGYLLVAGEQASGRGRLGRSFFSPPGTGVYMSLLLRPRNVPADRAVRITTVAAVAMCEAMESLCQEKARIKWINDIFMRGKKVCGILTEASFGMESGVMDYAVLGLGVNVYRPEGGFPEELDKVAGAVLPAPLDDGKNRLTAGFLNRFMTYYAALDQMDYAKEYRERCFVIGRRVTVHRLDQSQPALALGIDDDCHLLVRYDDGREESLSSGEISVRLPAGYEEES